MNYNDYIDLCEFLDNNRPKPLRGDGTPEQIRINGIFFTMCCRLVPQMIQYIKELESKPEDLECKNKELYNKIDGAISILKDGRCTWCDWD